MAKNEKPQEINSDYIEDRYNDQIKYYWKKSTSNKNYYGLTQTFHWGATWRDMVVSATRLEKERDLMVTTPKNKRDFQKELDNLNSIVLSETKSFFARVLDSEVKPKDEE